MTSLAVKPIDDVISRTLWLCIWQGNLTFWNFPCLVSILRCLAIFGMHNFKSTYHSVLSSSLTTFTPGTWKGHLSPSVNTFIFLLIFCKMDHIQILVYCALKLLPIVTSKYIGLIVCNTDVSFQIPSTMMHFIEARWQQHKGVMWLYQLQSLQVTQPLVRWLMMKKWCGCVSCKVCKWHSQLVDDWGRKSDVAVWAAKFATDTATW